MWYVHFGSDSHTWNIYAVKAFLSSLNQTLRVRLLNWERSMGKIECFYLQPVCMIIPVCFYLFFFFLFCIDTFLQNNFSYWLYFSRLDLVVWNIFIMLLLFDPTSQRNFWVLCGSRIGDGIRHSFEILCTYNEFTVSHLTWRMKQEGLTQIYKPLLADDVIQASLLMHASNVWSFSLPTLFFFPIT